MIDSRVFFRHSCGDGKGSTPYECELRLVVTDGDGDEYSVCAGDEHDCFVPRTDDPRIPTHLDVETCCLRGPNVHFRQEACG